MSERKKLRPRVFVSLDPLTFDLLQEAADSTGFALSLIVSQLMRSHVRELRNFNDWVKCQDDAASAHDAHGLHICGSSDVPAGMLSIVPVDQGLQSQSQVDGSGVQATNALAELRELFMERRARKLSPLPSAA